jgi:hypothetical protein
MNDTSNVRVPEFGASHIAFYTDDIAGETWVHFRAPWGRAMKKRPKPGCGARRSLPIDA